MIETMPAELAENLIDFCENRDRVYALENPGYRKLYQIFAVNGVTVRPTPLDKHGLRADALTASDASVVYLTPSHHSRWARL